MIAVKPEWRLILCVLPIPTTVLTFQRRINSADSAPDRAAMPGEASN